jgi:hypothetical protein
MRNAPPSTTTTRDKTDGGVGAIFETINSLSSEEEELYRQASDGSGLSQPAIDRLDAIRVELDRCYDLLHQRQARIAAGLDPDEAKVRPAEVVEHYQQ